MNESKMTFTIDDIRRHIVDSYQIVGNWDRTFSKIRATLEADEESLVFIDHKRKDKQQLAEETKAGFVICDNSMKLSDAMLRSRCFILVGNPKFVFMKVANRLFVSKPEYDRHPTASVHPEAKIHPHTYIGPFTYVGKSVIGEGTIIWGHCHIHDKVIVGKNVKIGAGCVIGGEGYGYLRGDDGIWEHFPHVGGVLIEDNVNIGSNTSIDRGALGNTIIRQGAKIDNLVHVAHNVVIGRHAAIIANTMIGGSTVIGDYAYVASATVRDVIHIGNRSMIGLGAVVTKDVPANEIWIGVPARPLEEFRKMQQNLKELS